jgi:hypothetical protein
MYGLKRVGERLELLNDMEDGDNMPFSQIIIHYLIQNVLMILCLI